MPNLFITVTRTIGVTVDINVLTITDYSEGRNNGFLAIPDTNITTINSDFYVNESYEEVKQKVQSALDTLPPELAALALLIQR